MKTGRSLQEVMLELDRRIKQRRIISDPRRHSGCMRMGRRLKSDPWKKRVSLARHAFSTDRWRLPLASRPSIMT